jgi:hypothetical protein
MPKRNRKGQFVKGASRKPTRRRRSTALARRGTTAPARRSVAVRRRSSTTYIRRRAGGGGGGGSLGRVLSYVGGPSTSEVVASAGLGLAVSKRRATVETVINYAPEFVRPVGAYGVIALGAGLLAKYGIGRQYTAPLARVATIIAVNKLTTRGAWYEPGQLSSSLSGDDDVGSDEMDVGALDIEGDDDIGDDDDI